MNTYVVFYKAGDGGFRYMVVRATEKELAVKHVEMHALGGEKKPKILIMVPLFDLIKEGLG